jgi:hypothetical protein
MCVCECQTPPKKKSNFTKGKIEIKRKKKEKTERIRKPDRDLRIKATVSNGVSKKKGGGTLALVKSKSMKATAFQKKSLAFPSTNGSTFRVPNAQYFFPFFVKIHFFNFLS